MNHTTALQGHSKSGPVKLRWTNDRIFAVSGIDQCLLETYHSEDQARSFRNPESPNDRRALRRAQRESAHDLIFTTGLASMQTTQAKTKPVSNNTAVNHAIESKEEHQPQVPSFNANSTNNDSDHDHVDKEDDADDDDHVSNNFHPLPRGITLSKRGGTFKRRRRGGVQSTSRQVSREPSPELPLLAPEEDFISDDDLPSPFTDDMFEDPNLPADEAQALYNKLYEPMTQPDVFITPLVKFLPGQRTTDNLYVLAANTAAALRAWQDEYLELEKITAPHAAIPRKAATGQRGPIDHMIFEDQKEADLYDYVFDSKKVGMQDPIAQKVVRDAAGRELRTRQPRGQANKEASVVAAAAAAATAAVIPEEIVTGRRARKPVAKYDGVVSTDQAMGRKRGADAMSETPEAEPIAKRGKTTGRGRGGRGGRGSRGGRGGRGNGGGGAAGGRGGLMSKRIQEMREESAAISVTPSEEELSGSDVGSVAPDTRENSPIYDPMPATGTITPGLAPESVGDPDSENGPSLTASGKKKGRPKGSKNHHKRSDAGIPKGPRVPKAPSSGIPSLDGTHMNAPASAESSFASGMADTTAPAVGGNAEDAPLDPKRKVPRSEKRSKSMVEWWARRKAKEAEDKAREAETQVAERHRAAEEHARYMQHHGGLIAAQQQAQHQQQNQQHQQQHQQHQQLQHQQTHQHMQHQQHQHQHPLHHHQPHHQHQPPLLPPQQQQQQFGGYTGPYPPTGVLPPPGPPPQQVQQQQQQQHWGGPGFALPSLQGPGGLVWHQPVSIHHAAQGLPPMQQQPPPSQQQQQQPPPPPPAQQQGQQQQGQGGQAGPDGNRRDQHGFVRSF
jgi:hypothetical protein